MPSQEFCEIHHPNGDQELLHWIQNASASVALTSPRVLPQKYGIKCPTMLRESCAIENLVKLSDDTKLVVGVRHPVLWYQSFYNYRVWGKYEYPDLYVEPIPSPFELNGAKDWRDVTMAYAKYEVYLQQLAKVPLSSKELRQMIASDSLWEKRSSPNPYKVFIYTDEQLGDRNDTRQSQFRLDMQEFLGLKTPLVDFNTMPKINSHPEVYDEYMDVCDPKYASIKQTLLSTGKKSSDWILNKFIKSRDVVVSNIDFFRSSVQKWGEDPCP